MLGYRKVAAPPFDVTRTFLFTVTSDERTKVFSGVAPVTPPQKSEEPKSSKRNSELTAMAGVIGLLLVALLLLFMRLRRSRKRSQAPPAGPAPVAAAAAPPKPEPSLPAAVAAGDGDEEPGWAGLLAAYESQPRHQTNGWHEQAEPEVGPEVEPEAQPMALAAVAAVAAVPEQVPEPGSEQGSEWGQTPIEARPVYEPEATAELAPQVAAEGIALWAVATRDTEPVAVVEEFHVPVDPESQFDAESQFELQPEPRFDPEPEDLPGVSAPEPEPAFEPRLEPWLRARVRARGRGADPAEAHARSGGLCSWRRSGSDRQHESESEPARQPTVIAPDELEQLILRHDAAIAESYFRPPAHPVAEPAPASPSPARPRNSESDASSSLRPWSRGA